MCSNARRILLVVVGLCAVALGAELRAAGPARIVSTSPSITETLFALGLGDRVVGVSTYCRFPPQVATLPKVGSFLKPDAELIAGLRPDLVIVHEVGNGLDRRLGSLRIPFIIVERGSLAGIFSSMRKIATAAGVPQRADALVGDVQRRLNMIRQAGAARLKRRVLFIIGRRPGMLADLIAIGPGSYINELIEIAGGTNVMAIAGQPEYPRISMETVLRLNPDVIVDTVDMGGYGRGAQRASAAQRAALEHLRHADGCENSASVCGHDRRVGGAGTAGGRGRRVGRGAPERRTWPMKRAAADR